MKLKTLPRFLQFNAALSVAFLMWSPVQSATVATFDWDEVEIGTQWWLGYGYTETDNGVTMVSGGRAASFGGDDGTTPGGDGFALKASYPDDADPGTFVMQVGGVDQLFSVSSIDISANDSGGEFTPSVAGALSGETQWSIAPTTGGGFATYTSATSGDMSLLIDTIVWNTGVSSNPDGTFGNNIDNLAVNVIPEPASLLLACVSCIGTLLFWRRLG